jgi:hypothetical protein
LVLEVTFLLRKQRKKERTINKAMIFQDAFLATCCLLNKWVKMYFFFGKKNNSTKSQKKFLLQIEGNETKKCKNSVFITGV